MKTCTRTQELEFANAHVHSNWTGSFAEEGPPYMDIDARDDDATADVVVDRGTNYQVQQYDDMSLSWKL